MNPAPVFSSAVRGAPCVIAGSPVLPWLSFLLLIVISNLLATRAVQKNQIKNNKKVPLSWLHLNFLAWGMNCAAPDPALLNIQSTLRERSLEGSGLIQGTIVSHFKKTRAWWTYFPPDGLVQVFQPRRGFSKNMPLETSLVSVKSRRSFLYMPLRNLVSASFWDQPTLRPYTLGYERYTQNHQKLHSMPQQNQKRL